MREVVSFFTFLVGHALYGDTSKFFSVVATHSMFSLRSFRSPFFISFLIMLSASNYFLCTARVPDGSWGTARGGVTDVAEEVLRVLYFFVMRRLVPFCFVLVRCGIGLGLASAGFVFRGGCSQLLFGRAIVFLFWCVGRLFLLHYVGRCPYGVFFMRRATECDGGNLSGAIGFWVGYFLGNHFVEFL